MNRPATSRRVVVGVDRSFCGLQALRAAVHLAHREKACLHAVRAWAFVPVWRPGTMPWLWQEDLARAYVRQAFDAPREHARGGGTSPGGATGTPGGAWCAHSAAAHRRTGRGSTGLTRSTRVP
ncbi:universal stress protein [Micromonospora avicenniae]|uniref:universal stress protein n=1 Tax=Micromonospora avicenniae TaxID=1198245 RepID=UPI0033231553